MAGKPKGRTGIFSNSAFRDLVQLTKCYTKFLKSSFFEIYVVVYVDIYVVARCLFILKTFFRLLHSIFKKKAEIHINRPDAGAEEPESAVIVDTYLYTCGFTILSFLRDFLPLFPI